MTDPAQLYESIREEVETVLIGKESVVEGLTISLLTGGHVLLEGVPGVAKTTAAHLFTRATGLDFTRIQMTPDILPADITGTKIYREGTGEFELQEGPVFANVVVADEINRATPKTQSALLEAMQEKKVTIEGDTLELPRPFVVVATQNPIEMEGTFALPEAQRDRFQFKLTVDVPDRNEEFDLLERFDEDPDLGPQSIDRAVELGAILDAQRRVADIYVDPTVKNYVLDLVETTRSHASVEHGASPRASLTFVDAAKARAAIRGREYVIPEDVKSLAMPILRHRLVLNTEADLGNVTPEEVIEECLDTVESPGRDVTAPEAAIGDGGEPVDDVDD